MKEETATDAEFMAELGEELPVFLRYSKTMLAAQVLEFTVFQLTHIKKKTPTDMDRAMRKLEGLLKQPPRDAAKHIDLDLHLFEDLDAALKVRNVLAHEFLTRFRIENAVQDDAVEFAVNALDAFHGFISDVQQRLDALAEDRLGAKDIHPPYLDDEEMDDLMQSLKKWAEEDRPELSD